MSTYTVALKANREIADRTMAFHFEKPAGFNFKPGQAVDVNLSAVGAAPLAHAFSLVSAPCQDELIIATRMRDTAFKRTLASLPVGARVTMEGPAGSLTLSGKNMRPAVFLAGGIGITPFMSMVQQATHDQSPRRLVLLYSNRRPEDSAFLEELAQLATRNPNLRLIATMTQLNASHRRWQGETGVIDTAKIRLASAGLTEPIFYLAGPPAMVEYLGSVLNDMEVCDDDIRSEEFFGY